MSGEIKVLYVLNNPTKYGGANKSFLIMLNGLVSNGVKPLVVLPKAGGICEEFEKLGIEYTIIKFHSNIYPPVKSWFDAVIFLPRLFRTLLTNTMATKKLMQVARVFEPKMIHTNVGVVNIGFVVAGKIGVPHIWHLREFQDLDFGMHVMFSKKNFIKKIRAANNYNIANSLEVFNHFSLAENSQMIYNGVFDENRARFHPNKQNYFLFAGRLEENKGIRELLPAFAKFVNVHTQYRLFVAGDTTDAKYKAQLLKQVDDLDLADKIDFLGMRDDIENLMANAIALIVPSAFEAFGRITAEAMFMGCLVIGKNTGGTKEIIGKGNFGILYNTELELVNSMNTIVEKGIESYFPVIEKAQNWVKQVFSNQRNVDQVFNFYNTVLSEKHH